MLRRNRAKAAIAVILAFVLSLVNIMPGFAVKFSDISSYWARDSIIRLAAQNIVTGFNGKFNPTSGVTRVEFAVMMIRALGLADQAEVVKGSATGYKDVPSSHWASGFVIIAKEKGIITGYPDETFRPSSLIRRDEITSVLVRALDLAIAEEPYYLSEIFSDWKKIPSWATESIMTAYYYKLINGFPDGSFCPDKNATRGETAALIEKVLHQLGTEYTFYGKTQSVDPVSRTITVDISGQIESFSYVPQLQVKLEEGSTTVENLKPGKDIFLILDDQGYVVYVEEAAGVPEETLEADDFLETQLLYSPSSAQQVETKDTINNNAVSVIVLAREGRNQELIKFIESNGGSITSVNRESEFILARVNSLLFKNLRKNHLVEEITRDDIVKAEKLAIQGNEGTTVNSEDNAGLSLNATKQAINAPEFVKVTHSVGRNQIIAVLDTGIDPGHPDLQKTPGGKQKIIEWLDFTEEGDIHTIYKANRAGNKLDLSGTEYYVAGIKSASGVFKYGYLREIDITDNNGKNGYDLNFNRTHNDVFAVIVVEGSQANVYDTIYVDTNANLDFTDEEPLKAFSKSFNYAGFAGSEGKDRLNFVLTRISTDGTEINISFDGNDHGTHVAGIIAAHGNIKGVAPGAQLMALKVLNAEGKGSLGTITDAISYAASHGAKIINLSLGIPISESDSDDDDGGSIPAKLLNKLTEKYGTIFVMAAGNDGPGLGTVNTPGEADGVISVGAFITPDMWKNDYGWDVPGENLWFFSSIGPRRDGAVSPSIVAPGSAISTVPLRGGKQYFLSEGTSIAAPHVAGAVALLMEVVQRNNLKVSPYIIKRAIELGARPVQGYEAAEQGYGAVNLPISWAELVSLQENRVVSGKADSPGIKNGAGLLFREGLPQRVTVNLYNDSQGMKSLALSGSRWVKPAQSYINIPPGKNRAVDVDVEIPEEKGVFSWFISGDDSRTYGKDLQVLTTVVNPYLLSEKNNYAVSINDVEKPAQYKRYFFKVPVNADSIKAKITVPGKKGRAKIYLFDPKSRLVAESPTFAGANHGGGSDSVTVIGDSPSPGVWECVVYSSAGMSNFGVHSTEFSLDVALAGVNSEEPEQKPRDVIVGVLPKQLTSGNRDYITVQIRERQSKKPFSGFVEINGRLFYSRRGKVTIPVDPYGDSFSLVVKTVPGTSLVKPWEFDFIMFYR